MRLFFRNSWNGRRESMNALTSCNLVSLIFALVAFAATSWSLWTIFTADEIGKSLAIGAAGLLLLTCSYLLAEISRSVSAKIAEDDADDKEREYLDRIKDLEDALRNADDEILSRLDGMEGEWERRIEEIRRETSVPCLSPKEIALINRNKK